MFRTSHAEVKEHGGEGEAKIATWTSDLNIKCLFSVCVGGEVLVLNIVKTPFLGHPDNKYIQVTRISCPSQSPERPIDQHVSIRIGVSTPLATSEQPSEPSKIKIFHLGVIMVFFSTRYKNKPSRDNTDAPTFSEFLAFLVGNFFVLDFHWDWF